MRATEIVLHFDEREIKALQNALDCFSDESCTVEQKLREAFDSLYTELVPPEMQNAIEMEILKEALQSKSRPRRTNASVCFISERTMRIGIT